MRRKELLQTVWEDGVEEEFALPGMEASLVLSFLPAWLTSTHRAICGGKQASKINDTSPFGRAQEDAGCYSSLLVSEITIPSSAIAPSFLANWGPRPQKTGEFERTP